MSKIGTWTTTAADNNAAAPDGWPEGQAPSTVNNCAREMMSQIKTWFADAQWTDLAHSPTYVSPTSFTIPSDVTAIYERSRRLKCYGTILGNIFASVVSATYGAPNTTVTILPDSTSLTSNLSQVYTGVPTVTSSALPNKQIARAFLSASFALTANTFVKIPIDTITYDVNSIVDLTNRRIIPKLAGTFLVMGQIDVDTSNGDNVICSIFKNGTEFQRGSRMQSSGADLISNVQTLVSLNGTTDYVELLGFCDAARNINLTTGAVSNSLYLAGPL
jgi:hypothetical protein